MLIPAALLITIPCAAEIYAFGAAPVTLADDTRTHGIVFVGARLPEVAGGNLELWINTDTLHARLDRVQLAPGLYAGARFDGEVMFAGLLTDYYRRGAIDAGRGFAASYLSAAADLSYETGRHSLRESLAVREWLFRRRGSTDPAFVLPNASLVLEERLNYTYWGLGDDASFYEWHRTTPRIRGFAFGVELGLDVRTNDDRWGDERNRPGHILARVRQWSMAGVDLGERVRLQAREWAGTGLHEDDLSRMRIGGNTPYAVPLVGAPWPAFLATTYAATEVTLPIRLGADIEVGPLFDAVALTDRDRDGGHDVGAAGGAGVFADARWDAWQFDLRGGWSIPTGWQLRPQGSIFLTVGRSF